MIYLASLHNILETLHKIVGLSTIQRMNQVTKVFNRRGNISIINDYKGHMGYSSANGKILMTFGELKIGPG